MHRRTLVVAGAASLVGGCSGMRRKDQASRLNEALSAYAGAIRWGNLDAAGAFASPREGVAAGPDPASMRGLRVTGYTIRVNRVNEAADEADVSMDFTYYHEDLGTVRQASQSAVWYFEPERRVWLLDGALPAFRR